MSPCTKKLSDIKGKRFKKYVLQPPNPPITSCVRLSEIPFSGKDASACNLTIIVGWIKLICHLYSAGKPQSLFAKLGKKSYEQSSAEQVRED
jgi:hypothetical protein